MLLFRKSFALVNCGLCLSVFSYCEPGDLSLITTHVAFSSHVFANYSQVKLHQSILYKEDHRFVYSSVNELYITVKNCARHRMGLHFQSVAIKWHNKMHFLKTFIYSSIIPESLLSHCVIAFRIIGTPGKDKLNVR